MAGIFTLHGKGLKLDTAEDLEPHLANLDPTKIIEIHLGGNTVGVGASERLAQFILQATSLQIADFADIFTGRLISEIPLALTAICDALKDHKSLVEVNLSDNAFGGRVAEPMVPLLTHNRSLQTFKLNNNGLGPAGGAVIANAIKESAVLSKAEGRTSNLRTVICGRNRLEDGSASVWAEAFAAHGTLEEVRMPQNGIRMTGITALAKGLAKCPGLQYIDLQDNTFTEEGDDTGIQAWTEGLKSWPGLTTLNLSDCVLSGEGEVPALITALAAGSNPRLVSLQLQNNNLESNAFEVIAGAIGAGLASVMSLELQWNEVEEDDEHVETLSASLKQRGGKLTMSDEEDEEDEKVEEAVEEAVPTKSEPAPLPDSAADDLADLLSKVNIK